MTDASHPDDSPLQARMRAALRVDDDPPARDPRLQTELRRLFESLLPDGVVEVLRNLDGSQPLWVDRIPLSNVMACEQYYQYERGVPFQYTVDKARTQTAGAMLRRWAFRDPRAPSGPDDRVLAVHELLDDLAQEPSKLGEFITGISGGSRADMAAAVLDIVQAFEESWPPDLQPQHVQAFAPLKTTMYGSRLVLHYRAGFRFGRPHTQGGQIVSDVVLLDIRPGLAFEQEERHNRWFAALIETLRAGVAPARVATWYAESQDIIAEDIEDGMLEAAVRRAAEGVVRMVSLGVGSRAATVMPGWRCSFCDLLDDCPDGQAYKANWLG